MNVETIGMIFIFIQILAAAVQPVLTKLAVGTINPLFAAAVTPLIGFIIPFVLLTRNGTLKILFDKKNLKEFLMIGFFGTVMTYLLFFSGAKLTSGINTAILIQAEPIYSILLGYFVLKEKITSKQILFTLLIIVGVIIVIYNGAFSLSLGDFLILLTPLFYQISHVIAKKTINRVGTVAVQGGRYLFGGIILLLISSLLGMNQFSLLVEPQNFSIIFTLGIIVAGIGTLAFYEAIKRINLSKTTAMIAPYSVISVMLAWFVLKEVPTIYQIIGLILMLIGIFSLAKIRSEKRN
jgi:drug/metabolite transporter (DMT)-like permease